MSSCWTTAIRKSRSTNFLQFGSKAPLKKLRNQSLSLSLSLNLRRGSRRIRSWLRVFGSMKLASRYSEDTDLNEQRPATNRHKIMRTLACLLALRRFWRRRRCLFLGRLMLLHFFRSPSGTRASPPDPDNRPTVKGEVPFPYNVISFYFLIFHKYECIATGPLNYQIRTRVTIQTGGGL